MDFEEAKQAARKKMHTADHSRKGSVDTRIQNVVDDINQHPDYFTTSSCSGRILVITEPQPLKKHLPEWLYMSHAAGDASAIWEAISKTKARRVWFKQEGPILHVSCRTIGAAERLLRQARQAGYKRAGCFSLGNKNLVEIRAAETMQVPVIDEGIVLLSRAYAERLVRIANAKLEKAWRQLKRFEQAVANLKN